MSLQIVKGKYFFKCKICVPNDYPTESVLIEKVESNYPRVFKVWFAQQAKEIARRCVQPPLKPKLNDPIFEPKPSLEHAAAHVERVYCSHVYHHDCLILWMKTPPFEGA